MGLSLVAVNKEYGLADEVKQIAKRTNIEYSAVYIELNSFKQFREGLAARYGILYNTLEEIGKNKELGVILLHDEMSYEEVNSCYDKVKTYLIELIGRKNRLIDFELKFLIVLNDVLEYKGKLIFI